MATRSAIGIRNEDDTISSVYCHWDGYPSHNGRILREYYTTRQKVNKLISLGDLSILGALIGEYNDFQNPREGFCLFYGRDRGENGVGHRTACSPEEFMDQHSSCDYFYLYENGTWFCAGYGEELKPISEMRLNS